METGELNIFLLESGDKNLSSRKKILTFEDFSEAIKPMIEGIGDYSAIGSIKIRIFFPDQLQNIIERCIGLQRFQM